MFPMSRDVARDLERSELRGIRRLLAHLSDTANPHANLVVPFHEFQEVEETGLTVAATTSLVDAGSPFSVTLPAGWVSMDVMVTCGSVWTMPATTTSVYLAGLAKDATPMGNSMRKTITNDRASTSAQSIHTLPAMVVGESAGFDVVYQQQAPVGSATLTALMWRAIKYRTA